MPWRSCIVGFFFGVAMSGSVSCGESVTCSAQPSGIMACSGADRSLVCCADGTRASQVPLTNCTETIYSACFCCDGVP